MPQFDFSVYLSQIFWMCVSFGILFWAMHTHVMPKILQLRQRRNEKKEVFLLQAYALSQQAHVLRQETEQNLNKARKDAATVVNHALKVSEQQLQQALYAHQQSYHAQMEDLKKVIESERMQAQKNLYDGVPELCNALIEKWSQEPSASDPEKP